MTDKSFGVILREVRKEQGLSQAQLGELINIHGSMISRFENDRVHPSLDQFQSLLDALRRHGTSQRDLDRLEVAVRRRKEDDNGRINAAALLVHQFMEKKLSPDEQDLFSDVVINLISVYRDLFQAQRESRQRQYEVADNRLNALERDKDDFTAGLCLQFYETRGDVAFSLSFYRDAIRYYQRAIQCSQQLEQEAGSLQGKLLIKLGGAYRRRAEWVHATNCYDRAVEILEEETTEVYADALRKRASVDLYRGQPRRALERLEESKGLCEAANYTIGLYKALQHLGWGYRLLGRWDEAVSHLQQALNLVQEADMEEVNQQWELLKAWRYLGDAFLARNDLDRAITAYEQAEGLIEELKARNLKPRMQYGDVWIGLAKGYLKKGQPLVAGPYLDKSLSSDISDEEVARKAIAQAERGYALYLLDEHQLAEQQLQEAIFHLRTLGDPIHHIDALLSLAHLYESQGRQNQLEDIAQQADELARAAGPLVINYQLSQIQILLGHIYLHRDEFSQAKRHYQRAFRLALDYNEKAFTSIMSIFLEEWEQWRRERKYHVLDVMFDAYQTFVVENGYQSEDAVQSHLERFQNERANMLLFSDESSQGSAI